MVQAVECLPSKRVSTEFKTPVLPKKNPKQNKTKQPNKQKLGMLQITCLPPMRIPLFSWLTGRVLADHPESVM
jgi:hypothetical protein